MLTFCKESDKFFVCLKSLKNLLTFPAHLIFFEYSFYTCNLKKTWKLKLLSRVHLRHFCVNFLRKEGKYNLMAFKKIRSGHSCQKYRLKRRSSRFLRHIMFIVISAVAVIFFCHQNRPVLWISVFQLGLTAHRVYPGVSGWVYKVFWFKPNKWSIEGLIPEISSAKRYSKEWHRIC